MEARAPEKKLSRRERVQLYGIPDEDIPDRFIDQTYTHEIMERPGEVDGKIVDLCFVEEFQIKKLDEIQNKKQDGKMSSKEILEISRTNPYTRVPHATYNFLKDLDKEIEEWLSTYQFLYELREKAKKAKAAKAENLRKLELLIEDAYKKIYELMNTNKEEELSSELQRLEKLNKWKDKITMDEKYYKQPDVLQHEISRLSAKKDAQGLTEDEDIELAYCYTLLDAKPNDKPLMMMRRSSPLSAISLFTQHFSPNNNDESRGLTTVIRFNRNNDL